MRLSFVIFSLFLLSFGNLDASELEKRYVSHKDGDFTVYYFNPIKISAIIGKTTGLSIDFTYANNVDTVVVNSSVLSEDQLEIESFCFKSRSLNSCYGYELFYVDKEKKDWKYRLSVKIPFSKFKELFSTSSPLEFSVIAKDGKEIHYAYSPKEWKKEQDLIAQIIYLIELNSKLGK